MTIGYIYRLFCVDPTITSEYIGSTKNIRQRKYKHKSACNKVNGSKYNYRVYQFIRSHGGWENWRMSVIEQIDFEHKWELTRREGEIIQSRGATLNSEVAGRTHVESMRIYREVNRETFNEKQKERRQNEKFECVCGGRYLKETKARHFKTAKHIKKYEQGLYEYINS